MHDYDKAIDMLESIARATPHDAMLLNDLSVAYDARAQARGFAPDHAAALDAAEHAWRIRRSPETAWNRALAVSAFHLTSTAERAWDDYLKIDSDQAWRQEAEARRAELRRTTIADDWNRMKSKLAQDTAAVNDVAQRFPAQTLVHFEEKILPFWARARLSGSHSEETRLRGLGRTVAAALARNGERLPLDTLAAVSNACASAASCDALGRAHLQFADARDLMEKQQFDRAAAVLAGASAAFEQFRSPYALAARFQRAACLIHENKLADAAREGESLLSATDGRGYRTLHARSLWLIGLTQIDAGRPEESIQSYERAKRLFEDANDLTNVASVELLLADATENGGDRDAAMEHRLASFKVMHASGDLKQLHHALFEAGSSMDSRGWSDAADFLLGESVREAVDQKRFIVAAVASMWRSTIASRRGDLGLASEEARMAGVYSQQMTDPGQRALAAANVNQLAAARQGGRNVVESLTETIHFFERTGNRAWLPQLLRQRALLYENVGNQSGAEADFRKAIDVAEQVLDNAAPATMRDGFAADIRADYEDVIRLLLAKGASLEALSYAERARLIGHGEDGKRDVLAILDSVPRTTAVAVYELQPDALVVWLITHGSVTLFRSPEGRAAAATATAGAGGAPTQAALAALYDLLIRNWIAHVGRARELVVVPPPELAGVSFAALVNRDSGRAVIDDYSVTVAGSLASLREGPVTVSASDPALIVGDPAYSDLPRLPRSREEAVEVARHFENPALLLGDGATGANVLRDIGHASVFHFSGHAVANELSPELSSLMLAPADGNDSRIYVHELLQRRLPLKLVVLSACSTAKGRAGGTRGTLTIARAFLDSGARTVVATLWPVSDDAAASFAVALHDALSRGESVAAAARSAQLHIKSRSGGDPTWAAFCVLQGRGGSS